MSKIFRTKFGRNAENGIGRSSAISCPMEETERSIDPAKSCFLMQNDPDYWSAVPVRTECVLQLLTSTWKSHVSL